jgi:hypothetical protein
MSSYEQKKIELELRNFTQRNFDSPSNCRNIDQIVFYVRELCQKIDEYEKRFNYVPAWAYTLLAQYNNAHNQLVYVQFTKAYA